MARPVHVGVWSCGVTHVFLEGIRLCLGLPGEVAPRPVGLDHQRVVRALVVPVLLELSEDAAQVLEPPLVVSEPRAHLVRGEAKVGVHHEARRDVVELRQLSGGGDLWRGLRGRRANQGHFTPEETIFTSTALSKGRYLGNLGHDILYRWFNTSRKQRFVPF